jgi:tetratricopeptide (TPR) repeat protein
MQGLENAEEIQRAVMFNIARCDMRLRRYATAIIYLEEYLDDAESEEERAEVFDMLIEAQEEAGALNSREQVQFLYRLSQEAYDNGEYESVIRLSEAMVNIAGVDQELDSSIHYNIGLSFYRLGRYAEAVPHLRRYVQEHPGDQEAAQLLSESEERSGMSTPETATP